MRKHSRFWETERHNRVGVFVRDVEEYIARVCLSHERENVSPLNGISIIPSSKYVNMKEIFIELGEGDEIFSWEKHSVRKRRVNLYRKSFSHKHQRY